MLLSESEDGFRVYSVTDANEFNKIRPLLIAPVTQTLNRVAATTAKIAPMVAEIGLQRTHVQILNEWEGRLKVKDRTFGLFLGVQDSKITAITTTELQIDSNLVLRCTMLFKFFKRNGLRQIIEHGLSSIEDWARERHCMVVQFPTNRNVKSTLRLLGGGFHVADTWIEKEI